MKEWAEMVEGKGDRRWLRCCWCLLDKLKNGEKAVAPE